MAEDHNSWNEEERRRAQFGRWLMKAWEWASETGRIQVAESIEELVSHVDEPDYPLWYRADLEGVIGEGKLATSLRKAIGIPVAGPVAVPFERELNYAPVIYLEEKVWREIHGQLGWANRYADPRIPTPNFWLWSSTANQVRFVMKGKAALAREAAESA